MDFSDDGLASLSSDCSMRGSGKERTTVLNVIPHALVYSGLAFVVRLADSAIHRFSSPELVPGARVEGPKMPSGLVVVSRVVEEEAVGVLPKNFLLFDAGSVLAVVAL